MLVKNCFIIKWRVIITSKRHEVTETSSSKVMNEQTRITVDGGENRGGWVKSDSRGKIFINQSNLYRSGCPFGRELTLLMSISTWLSLCVGVDLWHKSHKSKHFNISGRRGNHFSCALVVSRQRRRPYHLAS